MLNKFVSCDAIRSAECSAPTIMRRAIDLFSVLMFSVLSACSGQPAATESTDMVGGKEQEGGPVETSLSFEDQYKMKYGDKWSDFAQEPKVNAEPNADVE